MSKPTVTFFSSSGTRTYEKSGDKALIPIDDLESLLLEIGYFNENLGWDYADD